MIIHKIRKCG